MGVGKPDFRERQIGKLSDLPGLQGVIFQFVPETYRHPHATFVTPQV